MSSINKNTDDSGHDIASAILYGPVHSRRFGMSLGINLLPASSKLCSFNCVYCQLGWGRASDLQNLEHKAWPAVLDVLQSLEQKLIEPKMNELEFLVVSGNGEPTLHPQFAEISKQIHNLIQRINSKLKTICFSCGSELHKQSVQEGFAYYNEVQIKFDAFSQKINLPISKTLSPLDILKFAKDMPNAALQCCFVEGVLQNTSEHVVQDWLDHLKTALPKKVLIYTAERATAAKGLEVVSKDVLQNIAQRVRQLGVPDVRVI